MDRNLIGINPNVLLICISLYCLQILFLSVRNQSTGFPVRSSFGSPLERRDCGETLILSLLAEMPGVNYPGKDCV